MSQPDSTAPEATLGEKNLTTLHAVAQSLAIGPMISVALLLGMVALYWTIGVVIVALLWFAFLMITRRRKVDNAASHAAEHHGVPPLDETLEYGPAS